MMDCRFSAIYLILVLLLLPFDVDSESFSVSSNKTVVSPGGGVFELGFFNSGPNDEHWYIGIWYKNISERTYVWVGNRDRPLYNAKGTLEVSDSNLVLRDGSNNRIIWSTNNDILRRNERSPEVVAELLANGNLVLRYWRNNNPEHYLWQSFEDPTDTLLPEMKLRSSKVPNYASRRYLTAWKANNDPQKGNFIFGLDAEKFPRLLILKREGDSKLYRSGAWNGIEFTDLPLVFNSTGATEEDSDTFMYMDEDPYSRVTLNSNGRWERLTWDHTSQEWTSRWASSVTYCDGYNYCGTNSYCDSHTLPMCKCFKGFDLNTSGNMTTRCVRRIPLSCSGSRFSRFTKMKLPDTMDAKLYSELELKGCQDICMKDCQCTAYTVIVYRNGTSSSNCVTWSGDLVDMQHYRTTGQDLYIRLNGKKESKTQLILGLSLGIPGFIVTILVLYLVYIWKRNQRLAGASLSEIEAADGTTFPIDIETVSLMDFEMVSRATEDFSDHNEIGHGGFGKVYKGRVPNGQEIAVKKLLDISKEGTVEFENEVMSIANLQHINLVRLLGWSVHENERVLIYEYLENGNLEHHLFGGSSQLNWNTRFEIINGISQGLAYMQQGSRVMIIHRDLKPANILLDGDMIPKISDFGLARIFQRSENETNTTMPAGTQGYMSPEYVVSGKYSTKSDIFSFGVMLLEIVSGKQNRTFSYIQCSTNLLTYMWTKWNDGNWEEMVDEMIRDSSPFNKQQVRRCLEVGLLCVQQMAEDRPEMSSVLWMLLNEASEIPLPKIPGFYTPDGANEITTPTGSSSASTSTARRYSTTAAQP